MQNNWQIPKYYKKFDKTLNEIYQSDLETSQVLDYIDKNKDPSTYPFNNIFKEKWRLFFPLVPPNIDKSLVELYEKTMEFVNQKVNNAKVNWENLSISYDYSSEQGRQKREESLIKLLRKKQFPEQGLKILSDKSKLFSSLEKVNKYIVCFSRHPIDVLRMSDHDGWSSCHSVGSEYFKHAITEAKGNGPIAYLIKKEDITTFGADFIINNSEIFRDRQRNVDGIVPTARLRLRRYRKTPDRYDPQKVIEVAIPDQKIYGDNSIPFFYENVGEFAAKAQEEDLKNPELFDKSTQEEITLSDLKRIGGYYQDPGNSDEEIFTKFYDSFVYPKDGSWESDRRKYRGKAEHIPSASSTQQMSYIEVLAAKIEQLCDDINNYSIYHFVNLYVENFIEGETTGIEELAIDRINIDLSKLVPEYYKHKPKGQSCSHRTTSFLFEYILGVDLINYCSFIVKEHPPIYMDYSSRSDLLYKAEINFYERIAQPAFGAFLKGKDQILKQLFIDAINSTIEYNIILTKEDVEDIKIVSNSILEINFERNLVYCLTDILQSEYSQLYQKVFIETFEEAEVVKKKLNDLSDALYKKVLPEFTKSFLAVFKSEIVNYLPPEIKGFIKND